MPVYIERRGDAYVGRLLVPPQSWLTPHAQQFLSSRTDLWGQPVVLKCLAEEPVYMIEQVLRPEARALFMLTLLFLVGHLITLCAVSVGHGFALTAIRRGRAAGPPD